MAFGDIILQCDYLWILIFLLVLEILLSHLQSCWSTKTGTGCSPPDSTLRTSSAAGLTLNLVFVGNLTCTQFCKMGTYQTYTTNHAFAVWPLITSPNCRSTIVGPSVSPRTSPLQISPATRRWSEVIPSLILGSWSISNIYTQVDWMVDLYPKGVWFQRCFKICTSGSMKEVLEDLLILLCCFSFFYCCFYPGTRESAAHS